MTLYLYLKIGTDHVLRLNIVFDRRVGNDSAGGGTLCAADDPDRESVIIEIFYKLSHRQIEIVDVAHIVKTCGLLLAEFHRVVIELLDGHARISLCKVPRKRFVGNVAGFDRRGNLFELV